MDTGQIKYVMMLQLLRKIFFPLFALLYMQCFSQEENTPVEYKTFINGQELCIRLFPNLTYEFYTYWGLYHGIYEIISDPSDTIYDRILFYDDIFDTKKAWFHHHISIKDTNDCIRGGQGFPKTPYSVRMYDLTGSIVMFYSVCFIHNETDSVECHHNSLANNESLPIPPDTKKIEMIGEKGNLTSYFNSDYSIQEGSIAFIIGPSPGRFRINKRRDTIKYRPCYCDNFEMECTLNFKNNINVKSYDFIH